MKSAGFCTPTTLPKVSLAPLSVSRSSFCPRFAPSVSVRSPSFYQIGTDERLRKHFTSRQRITASTPLQTRTLVRFDSLLSKKKVLNVDRNTGKQTLLVNENTIEIVTASIPLPQGEVRDLSISTSRYAEADVFARKDVLENLHKQKTTFIIFTHGFSQVPTNYDSLLHYLAVQGYVVLAPSTWFVSVLFKKVETITWTDGFPAKLQTALLIDTARSLQVAEKYSSETHLLGHSMGGAMALVFSDYASSKIGSVGLLAPEVGGVSLTPLNQTVSLDKKDGKQRLEALAARLSINLCILHGNRDKIVPKKDMQTLFDAFQRSSLTYLINLVKGSHVGFEDELNVDLPFIRFEKFFFQVIDLIVYGPLDIFGLGAKDQLATTKLILKSWYEHILEDEEAFKKSLKSSDIPSEITYQCSSDQE